MATAQKFDSIKIGVCDCFWRPVPTDLVPNPDEIYLGLTKGGCELTYTPEWHDIQVDQFGKTASESVLVGEDVKVKVPLAETDLNKLELFCHTATKKTSEVSLTTVALPGGITGVPSAANSANTTAGSAGTKQKETITVTGGPADGSAASVIVTAAGMTGSPITVAVDSNPGETAAQFGGTIVAALESNPNIFAFFNISNVDEVVTLEAKVAAANDATMNIEIDGVTTGFNDVAASTNTTAGVAPTAQVETATVGGGAITDSGIVTVTVTANGMSNSPKAIDVNVDLNDTASVIAGKIRTALNADTDITDFFTVSGAGTGIILTANVAAANDATMNIAINGGSTVQIEIGDTSFVIADTTDLYVGDTIKIGSEYVVIKSISSTTITIKDSFTATHADGSTVYKVKPKLTFGRRPGLRLEDLSGRIRLHPIAMGDSLDEDVIIYRAINRAPLQLNYKLDEERIFQTEFQGIVARQSLEDEIAGTDTGNFLWQIGNPSI